MAKPKEPFDPLAGVTEKTKKEDLMARLRAAAAALKSRDRAAARDLASIEARLQERYKSQDREPLLQALVSGTKAEWVEAVDFLGEWGDHLPAALSRILVGGQTLLDPDTKAKV